MTSHFMVCGVCRGECRGWVTLALGSGLGAAPRQVNAGESSHQLKLASKYIHKADAHSLSSSPWPQVIKGTVNIQVGDVNDNAPQFHNQPYSVRIPEVGASPHGCC